MVNNIGGLVPNNAVFRISRFENMSWFGVNLVDLLGQTIGQILICREWDRTESGQENE